MKKWIALALSLVLVLALTACGGSKIPENVIKVGASVTPHAEILEQVERALSTNALAHFSGDLELVAEALKISPTTLWRKMRRHGLKPPKPGDS